MKYHHDGDSENDGDPGFSSGEELDLWRPRFAPIPEEFYSEETGEPFHQCVECGIELLGDDDSQYMIEKCSNGRETVFEFAMCTDCAESLHSSYSESSRAAISQFFQERVDPEARIRQLIEENEEPSADAWLRACLACGNPPVKGKSNAIVALCGGAEIIFTHAPFLVCETCELALNELISKETRGEWDRFIGRNFDMPPSAVITPDTPLVIV